VAGGQGRRTLTVVVPGDLQTRTGGYGYDRRIVAGLRERGWEVNVVSLDDTFPFPTPAAREEARRAFAAIPDRTTVVADGLALGALPEEAERARDRLNLIALVHHPLAEETGLDASTASALAAGERRSLAAVRSVVVTSESTAALLGRYGVGPERIAVVHPGTDQAPAARGSARASGEDSVPIELTMVCVATLTPRKGHQILFRALASLPHRRWRLRCAGSLDRDRSLVERLSSFLRDEGLQDRVELLGDLDADRLAVEYERSDLFVLATLYEGYGMAVAEALARGLAVVSTATGNIPALVGDDAGIVVPPNDEAGFREALAHVVGDPALRRRLAAGARRVRGRLPTWADSVSAMARLLASVPQTGSQTVSETGSQTVSETGSQTVSQTGSETVSQTVSETGSETVCDPGFSAEWLALREPADRAARSGRLARRVASELTPDRPVRIIDLGAGTGANMRYLSDSLPGPQRWLLVDHDASLLARATPGAPASAETRELDLNAVGEPASRPMFSGVALITASALLDLVSAVWLCSLADRAREHGAALLFALTYDGRIELDPAEPEDAEIRDLVNRHQRTDKGFGPALGPDATDAAAAMLESLGYHVERERSDWRLGPESHELQRELIEGWARAAGEIDPLKRAGIDTWRGRRLAHVDQQRSRIVVGHEDLAAWVKRARREG
jgi:glycosyltransferase involved in cell wall biosynthesis